MNLLHDFVSSFGSKKLLPFLVLVLIATSVYADTLANLINDIAESDNQFCNETDCFFPSRTLGNEDIVIDNQIIWQSDKNLVLHTKGSIIFKKNGKIINKKSSSIILKSGMEPGEKTERTSTVIFEGKVPQIDLQQEDGVVKIYYNPQERKRKYKYQNPHSYRYNINPHDRIIAFMLLNDVDELQYISQFLSGNYALSQNIDASETQHWAGGKGFRPMGGERQEDRPFCGNFDGNNYEILHLNINRPEEDNVAIFALTSGHMMSNNNISNLHIKQANIVGNFRVGTIIGEGFNTNLVNVSIEDSTIDGYGPVGSLAGALQNCYIKKIEQDDKTKIFIYQKQLDHKQLIGAMLSCTLDQEPADDLKSKYL